MRQVIMGGSGRDVEAGGGVIMVWGVGGMG